MEAFAQKHSRAYRALGMDELGEKLLKAKQKHKILYSVCVEGLLWHAFGHNKKEVTND